MNKSVVRGLQRVWRLLWRMLPGSALPLRIRLAGEVRQFFRVGEPSAGIVLSREPGRNPRDAKAYQAWVATHEGLSGPTRAAIDNHIATISAPPLISIVMPVHETPALLLQEAIDSVRAQLYPNWELCIADDASQAPHVGELLAAAAANDSRIRWVRRDTNGHISAATNTALTLARGQFVAFMDHDDLLAEHALYAIAIEIMANPDVALIYSDEDKIDSKGGRFDPYFKPDFDPDLLLQQNFINHLGVYRRDLLGAVGGLRIGFEGSQDHDLALRFSRKCGADRIRHIPFVLYHWRQSAAPESFSQTALDRCMQAGRKAAAEALAEAGIAAALQKPPLAPTHWRVLWPLPNPEPLVSVIVPTRDHPAMLAACANGVLQRTDYRAIEFIVVDNGSIEQETFALFERLRRDARVRILPAAGPFNYSALNNSAAAVARGEVLLLLNNDIDVMSPGWLRELVSQAIRPDVGAVGSKLRYADNSLQHGGVVIGMGGVAGHYLPRAAEDEPGHHGSLALVREVGAVTGACLALRREVFEAVGGLDADNLPVAFNDIDLCLRIREKGWRVLCTPFGELYHLESVSRGDDLTGEKARRFAGEVAYMMRRWGNALNSDPFANPNLDVGGPVPLLAIQPPRFQPWAHRVAKPSGERVDRQAAVSAAAPDFRPVSVSLPRQ